VGRVACAHTVAEWHRWAAWRAHTRTRTHLLCVSPCQVALVVGSFDTPMGAPGFILPLSIAAMTCTTIYMGIGAATGRLDKDIGGDKFGG
jgi:hypothetical protein